MSRLAATYAELEAVSRALRDQADALADEAAVVRRSAFDGALAEAAVMAPAEVVAVEGQLLDAAVRAEVLVVELQVLAWGAAQSAEFLAQADEMLAAGLKALTTVRHVIVVATDAAVDWAHENVWPVVVSTVLDAAIVLLYGARWPAVSHEEAAAGMLALTEALGLAKDSDLKHSPLVGNDKLGNADLTRENFLYRLMTYEQTAYDNDDGSPKIVITTMKVNGRVVDVVNIPGMDFDHLRGATGIGSAFATMDDTMATSESGRSQLVQEVVAVMREHARQQIAAGIEPGEVILSGHSLGGMSAASIASDPDLVEEFKIQGIVTQGSPIAHYPVDDGVDVLAFEHEEDEVTLLDGADNPKEWTTIRTPDPRPDNGVWAHKRVEYQETVSNPDRFQTEQITGWLANQFGQDTTGGRLGNVDSQYTSDVSVRPSGSQSW